MQQDAEIQYSEGAYDVRDKCPPFRKLNLFPSTSEGLGDSYIAGSLEIAK
jgi:hypothetical protein